VTQNRQAGGAAQQRRLDARTSQQPRRPQQPPKAPTSIRTCRDCGTPLNVDQSTLCGDCWIPVRSQFAHHRAAKGRAGRARTTKDTGVDPTQTVKARAQRSSSLVAERTLRDAWDAQHAGEPHDANGFAAEVLPGLAAVPLGAIVAATGMSVSAASRIRRGLLQPHPRHWDLLRALVLHET